MAYSDYDLLPKIFVLNGTVKTTGSSAALTAGDFGLYDAESNAVVTVANVADHPNAYIAQGSYYVSDTIGGLHGGYKESIKSPAPAKGINVHNVKRFYKVAPRVTQNQIVRLFWDGSASGLGSNFKCGKTYNLLLELQGTAVLRFINHYVQKPIGVFSGCCNEDCTTLACEPRLVDSAVMLLKFADKINADPILSRFVVADVISKAATKTASTTSGNAVISVADATGIKVGQSVSGTGIGAGAKVLSISGLDITLDKNSTATASVSVLFTETLTSATYVSPTLDADKALVVAGLNISVTYTATSFGDCSFNPGDYVEESFVDVHASMVYNDTEFCQDNDVILNSSTGVNFTEIQPFITPKGLGEVVLREFISSQLQSGIYFSHDPRSREVSGNIAMTAVDRAAKYVTYHLIYSVGQTGNPSNALSHDQYILEFAVKDGVDASAFEALMTAWLATGNPAFSTIEVIV